VSYIYLYDVMFMVLVGAWIFGFILLANENTKIKSGFYFLGLYIGIFVVSIMHSSRGTEFVRNKLKPDKMAIVEKNEFLVKKGTNTYIVRYIESIEKEEISGHE